MIVTFKNNPLHLVGRKIETNFYAPDFKVISKDLKEVTLQDFKEKVKVITSFISLDTSVCDTQIKEFNKRASQMGDDVIVIGISKDLPFAQERFCESFSIKNVKLFSDYKTSSFGINYGLYIQEWALLARSILILDKNNVLRYIQIAKEISESPNYDDAMANLEIVLKTPVVTLPEKAVNCLPCEGDMEPLSTPMVQTLLRTYKGWEEKNKQISKRFKFKDFKETKFFVDLVAVIAEEQGHHPVMTMGYNYLNISLTTHMAGGITENDFILAKMIDELSNV